MLPRFFAPDLDPEKPELTLTGDEAHHLHRVLRLRVDDELVVFDGRGTDVRASVSVIGRESATVRLLEPLAPSPAPVVPLTLVQSILKGEAMDDVIRDCVMLGVDSIQPIVSERTTVKTSTLAKAGERWARIALAAAKQAGRSRLPGIRQAFAFEEWLRQEIAGARFILLEPAASAGVPGLVRVRELAHRPVPDRASILVGPEGGWTVRERDTAMTSGWRPLSLGRLTLRADAVPLAAAAALLAVWDERAD